MTERKSPDPVEDYRQVQREVREWETYLNDNVGFFSFTFAIASLGTPQPQFWAFVSMVFLITMHRVKKKGKISLLVRLEKIKVKTEYEKHLEKEIRKSIKISRAAPFIIGYIVLTLIILAPPLIPSKKGVNFIYGNKPYFDVKTFSIVIPDEK
ncbi:hypothetical protein [Pseudomonas kuykendallii]|uniref:hypothetical protein n=1 Tax=Pseudomonas kuykendallii TaxID=1007099 RepID=UPI0028D229FA|nr:hypothetical protein [Pseudomonas kuykendallii]